MTAVEPFGARVVTRDYGERGLVMLPVSDPPAPPPLEECTREDLLDLAARAIHPSFGPRVLWQLLGANDYIAAIFRLLVEQVEPDRQIAESLAETRQQQLDVAVGVGDLLGKQLEASRRSEADLRVLHTAEAQERTRLADLHARISLENAEVRRENAMLRRELATALEGQRITAAFERVTITVTGENYRVVADRLTAAVHAEQRAAVDDRFRYADVDVAGTEQPPVEMNPDDEEIEPHTIIDADLSEPAPAEEVPLEPVVEDPDETLDMEQEDLL